MYFLWIFAKYIPDALRIHPKNVDFLLQITLRMADLAIAFIRNLFLVLCTLTLLCIAPEAVSVIASL